MRRRRGRERTRVCRGLGALVLFGEYSGGTGMRGLVRRGRGRGWKERGEGGGEKLRATGQSRVGCWVAESDNNGGDAMVAMNAIVRRRRDTRPKDLRANAPTSPATTIFIPLQTCPGLPLPSPLSSLPLHYTPFGPSYHPKPNSPRTGEILTIRLNLPIPPHNDSAQMRPLGQILKVEANMICFREWVKIDLFESQEVEWVHCAH